LAFAARNAICPSLTKDCWPPLGEVFSHPALSLSLVATHGGLRSDPVGSAAWVTATLGPAASAGAEEFASSEGSSSVPFLPHSAAELVAICKARDVSHNASVFYAILVIMHPFFTRF